MDLINKLRQARARRVPIIGISTVDQLACVEALREAKNGKGAGLFTSGAFVQWDSCMGWRGLNDEGAAAVSAMEARTGAEADKVTANPVDSLKEAFLLPEGAALVCMNFHLVIDGDGVSQGIQNLRNTYESTQRTLILLGPSIRVPDELTQDVVLLNEELPGRAAIEGIVTTLLTDNDLPVDPVQVKLAGDALAGLSVFAARQAGAMALIKSGVDVASCWELKRSVIEQTRGLKMTLGGPTFADIGGLANVIRFARSIAHNVRCVAFVDEIEKFLGGAGVQGIGDSSGTSQDALGAILRDMENNLWDGMILEGPAGAGKSLFAQSFGSTLGVPTFYVDLGQAKGGIVGQSEDRIRALLKTLYAVGGSQVYWIATCNSLQALPSALLRRFTDGIYYFDLPSSEERSIIWEIQCKAHGVPNVNRPFDEGWTGAEIRNCVKRAKRAGISLIESAKYQVPVAVSDAAGIKSLRQKAVGNFISAAYEGAYKLPAVVQVGRKLTIEGGD